MRTGGAYEPSWQTSLPRVAVAVWAVGVAAALAVAPSAAGAASGPRSARVISTAQNSKLGTILVAGDTVYTLKPSKTACTAKCLKAWPPVLLPRGVTTATAGMGVDESKLGTTTAAHGARQITYSGKRLYWFAKDTSPGQVHGNMKNKWGKWSTVTAATIAAPTTAPPTTAAPATAPPGTEAPATAPPATAPSATAPPATSPPATEAPATLPPPPQPTPPAAPKPSPSTSPGNGGIAF
jgi:predicted lipoprotein with Yx(FWY)xxD motif